jgi:hypothetical protein
MDDITRVCRKCGQEKPLSEFVKDKTRELGYSYTCKHCKREHACKYRADNHEKILERTRKHYAENSERYKEYSRKWRAANPEKEREMRRYKREILSDGYLRRQLKQRNLPVTPETIDYKRIQLKLYREIKNQQTHERD